MPIPLHPGVSKGKTILLYNNNTTVWEFVGDELESSPGEARISHNNQYVAIGQSDG